jgi:hypothetical protein
MASRACMASALLAFRQFDLRVSRYGSFSYPSFDPLTGKLSLF